MGQRSEIKLLYTQCDKVLPKIYSKLSCKTVVNEHIIDQGWDGGQRV